jgi:arginyl-tRNA synthetase
MFNEERLRIEEKLTAFLKEQDVPVPEEYDWTPIPFSGEWGIATPFFKIAAGEARTGKKVIVPQRAKELAELAKEHIGDAEGFSHIEAVNGYLNLFFSSGTYSQRVVDTVLEQGAKFGHAPARGEKVMVEYSQPNTHKPLHVGHLRNMILGATICNILEAAGYEVIRANYPGDTGLHVIKWMWNYQKNHANEEPPEDKIKWLGEIYAEAGKLLDEDPELEAEMRALFEKWEANDPEIMALWQQTRQWSIEGFNIAYDALDIKFDLYYWQSEVDALGKAVVDDLLERGIAEDERPDGPVIVKIDELLGLEKEKYRVMVALRSDNTPLYATWDLGLAIKKFEDYDLTRSIYVVDVRQSLHLQQVFKTLEIMGHDFTDKLYHLPYEIVNLPGNVTMASREGTVVLLEDLLREANARAYDEVNEKNPELDEGIKKEVARAVAMGAIKYPLIARDNTKLATFDWETALDFNGQAAPYIQYAHVRANSILRKADARVPESFTPTHELAPAEVELIDLISRVPAEIVRAADEYKTLHISNTAYDLAKAFSSFYNTCHVLGEPPEIRDARLRLVAATKQTLANLLGILGVPAPEVM